MRKVICLLSAACVLLLAGGVSACSDDDAAEVPNSSETPGDPVSPVEPAPEGSYTSETLYCMNGDSRIYGVMCRPAAGDRVPAVLLSHSYALTHAAMLSYAQAIAGQGCAAYCFDFCGGSSESLSDGDTSEMTVFTEVDDLKAVLATVRELDFVDPDRIFLLGSSQGGLVSALVAEDCRDEVCGMVLFYPAFNIAEMVNLFAGSSFGSSFDLFGMSEAYVSSLAGYDVFAHIGTYDGDVLILHGSNDMIVPLSYSEQAVALYPHAELQVIEGANHGFNEANLGGFGSMGGFGSYFGNYDEEVLAALFAYLAGHTAVAE